MSGRNFDHDLKPFSFRDAPDLTGRDDAAYIPFLWHESLTGKRYEGPRFGRAIDAAAAAARMAERKRASGLCPFVRCDHRGARPVGVMNDFAYVSYRVKRKQDNHA